MEKLQFKGPTLASPGSSVATLDTKPLPNSAPTSRQTTAVKAVDRLFSLTQLPDAGDPKDFLAGACAVFAEYPEEAQHKAVYRIAGRSDRPTLRVMREELEEAYAPIARAEHRRHVQLEARAEQIMRRQRTPDEQARVDVQVARARRELGITNGG